MLRFFNIFPKLTKAFSTSTIQFKDTKEGISQTVNNNEAKPGEGIRSLKTSSIFRAVNFELYAKPNRAVITFGVCAFSLSIIYLIVWRMNEDSRQKSYTAMDDQDNLVVRKKQSRWD